MLLNEYSQRKTATMVCFGDKQRELGESARAKAVTKYLQTISDFEPFLGRRYADADVQAELKNVGYKTAALPDGSVGVVVRHLGTEQTLSIVQIAGMLLGKLKDVAEKTLATKVNDAVIAVPVFFNDEQRAAMLAAAKIGHLNCLRLLNETSAVALGWGIYQRDLPAETETPRRVVFVDLGHATLQMSVCEFVKGRVTILATAHDASLGGRDFDLLLADHFTAEFKPKYKIDVNTNVRARMKLVIECEKLKQSMSANSTDLPMAIECLMDEKDVAGRMNREAFEALAAPLLARLEAATGRLLEALAVQSEGKLSVTDIDSVEIVGGTVRIPAVKAILHKVFQREPATTLNLDEIVAKGAALYAAIISPAFRVRQFEIVDKTPYGITLHWADKDGKAGSAEIFKAHGATKMIKALTFSRDSDFTLEARYTDPAAVIGQVASIGTFHIKGVQPAFDGDTQKVKLNVRLDDHGIFRVSEATMTLKPTPEEVAAAEAEEAAEAAKAEEKAKAAAAAGLPPPKKEEPKKKLRSKVVSLVVEEVKPMVLSDARLLEYIEQEGHFASQDRHETEKSNAKNALEEYLYYIRDKLLDDEVARPFIKDSDAEALQAKISEYESWLYEDGDDVERVQYADRLAGLKALGEPALARAREAEAVPAAEEAFRKGIVVARKFLDQHAAKEEQYAHIDDLEASKVVAEVAAAEKWLADLVSAQAKLPKFEAPVLTAAKLDAQRELVYRNIKPIVTKPKPVAPPPEPTPAAADAAAPAADAAPADATAAPAPEMHVD